MRILNQCLILKPWKSVPEFIQTNHKIHKNNYLCQYNLKQKYKYQTAKYGKLNQTQTQST